MKIRLSSVQLQLGLGLSLAKKKVGKKNSFGQINVLVTKKFWSKISVQKIFGEKNWLKKFWLKVIFGEKKFWSKKNFGQKSFLVKKIFWSKNRS